jgi:hypothetical protein
VPVQEQERVQVPVQVPVQELQVLQVRVPEQVLQQAIQKQVRVFRSLSRKTGRPE